jgi:hypothetical protein
MSGAITIADLDDARAALDGALLGPAEIAAALGFGRSYGNGGGLRITRHGG